MIMALVIAGIMVLSIRRIRRRGRYGIGAVVCLMLWSLLLVAIAFNAAADLSGVDSMPLLRELPGVWRDELGIFRQGRSASIGSPAPAPAMSSPAIYRRTEPEKPEPLSPQMQAAADRAMQDRRVLYAQSLEQKFLSQGIDLTVKATGKRKDTLRISWEMSTRPFVFNLLRSSALCQEAPNMGFNTVLFTDGEFIGATRLEWTGHGWRRGTAGVACP